ncbi:hypothetical protein [Stenotrophomonas sp. PS02289]|uniref:hypothetical protein n=1 Tax=Stenotrophomonas sp. PS02289 TaxID=2991422 RepID=UPI00249CE4A2|nr:hypothetical protein [Stenotrophomonas sp. PS02289]
MGVHTFIYGYIKEAWSGSAANGCEELSKRLGANDRTLELHNESVLGALPDADGWPPMSRHMFGWPPATDYLITYKGRPFHFAASLKEVDFEVRDWLDKFEALLRQMYWEEAMVHVQTAYLGEHTFTWCPKPEWVTRLAAGVLEPIASWDFTSTMDAEDLEGLRANRS